MHTENVLGLKKQWYLANYRLLKLHNALHRTINWNSFDRNMNKWFKFYALSSKVHDSYAELTVLTKRDDIY